jgi:hypothetical protein
MIATTNRSRRNRYARRLFLASAILLCSISLMGCAVLTGGAVGFAIAGPPGAAVGMFVGAIVQDRIDSGKSGGRSEIVTHSNSSASSPPQPASSTSRLASPPQAASGPPSPPSPPRYRPPVSTYRESGSTTSRVRTANSVRKVVEVYRLCDYQTVITLANSELQDSSLKNAQRRELLILLAAAHWSLGKRNEGKAILRNAVRLGASPGLSIEEYPPSLVRTWQELGGE